MSHEAIARFPFDIGDPSVDEDHRALADLLHALEQVCQDPATQDCRCDDCPERKIQLCHGRLADICSRVQKLLVEHFQREQALMDSLPRTPAARTHCERHRNEHVSFSTRYNFAAARLGSSRSGRGAMEIERLVFDWIRDHALRFDAELSALANECRPR